MGAGARVPRGGRRCGAGGEFGDLRGLVEQLSIGVQAELDKIQA